MRAQLRTIGLAVGIAIAVVVTLTLTADAHSTAELDEWHESVEDRLAHGLTLELIAEISDMMDRHPAYLPPGHRIAPKLASGGTQTASAPVDSTYRGMGSNWEQWRPLITSVWGAELADMAVCLVQYESGGNPSARNPSSGAAGLFQVMPFWWDHFGGDRYDPATNTAVAFAIYQSQGWTAWAVYNRGKC